MEWAARGRACEAAADWPLTGADEGAVVLKVASFFPPLTSERRRAALSRGAERAMLRRGSPLAGLRPWLAARPRLFANPQEPRRPLRLSSVRGGDFFRGKPAAEEKTALSSARGRPAACPTSPGCCSEGDREESRGIRWLVGHPSLGVLGEAPLLWGWGCSSGSSH